MRSVAQRNTLLNYLKKNKGAYGTDHYTRQAHAHGYAARSVYKLMELQQTYAFIRFGQTLLDIGAAPGSWSQYCSQIVGDLGKVVSVDSAPLSLGRAYHNVTMIEGDFFSSAVKARMARYTFHGVLSDLSPRTSGNKFVDTFSIAHDVTAIIQQLPELLFENGFALFKLFESAEVHAIRQEMKALFERCYTKKPLASRARSKEIYLIGFNYLHGAVAPPNEQWS